jgi:hypothetical protein
VREDGRIVAGEEWQKIIILQRGMEEAPENGKEWSHSALASGMNELINIKMYVNVAEFTQHI